MKRLLLVILMALGAGGAQASLVGRDINGNAVSQRDSNGVLDSSAVFLYDTTLNVTWLRNANANGFMTWYQAHAWASNLTVGGYSEWRLPTMIDTGTLGCNFAYAGTDCGFNVQTTSGGAVFSEMASLWYDTLGNKGYYDTSGAQRAGSGLTNSGDFQNIRAGGHWAAPWYTPGIYSYSAWLFDTSTGDQNYNIVGERFDAFAVRDGDVLATPIPAAAWLMLSGIGALGAAARRRKSLAVQS